jgi:uncharacterized HAD superfamily protein
MKIGLDFDGVFCNGAKLLNEGSQKLFGLKLPEDKTAEETLDKDQALVLKDFVFENRDNNLKLELVPNVVSSCRELVKQGHELQIITKRNAGVKIVKSFCKTAGIDIPVIGLKRGQNKSEFCRNIDVFLDDSVDNLINLQTVVPNCFLFVWPYNLNSNISPENRVHSWREFMEKIC